jgi:hypothetical protein
MDAEHRSTAEILLREAMAAKFVEPPGYEPLKAALARQFATVGVRRDDTAPWGPGNRAKVKGILLIGPSRAGKTTAVEQALAEMDAIVLPGGKVIEPAPISVECLPDFTPEGLWRQLLWELRFPTNRALYPNQLFQRVAQRLPMVRPTAVLIDEYANTFKPSKVGPKRITDVRVAIQGSLRSLMDDPMWPVPLIMIGTEAILDYLPNPEFKHVREKIEETISIDLMEQGSQAEIHRLHEVLENHCGHANLAVPFTPADEFWRRLMHACDLRRGLALDLILEVVLDAWRAGETLEQRHFAKRYQLHTGAGLEANPFLATAWHLTDPSKFFEAAEASGSFVKRKST